MTDVGPRCDGEHGIDSRLVTMVITGKLPFQRIKDRVGRVLFNCSSLGGRFPGGEGDLNPLLPEAFSAVSFGRHVSL